MTSLSLSLLQDPVVLPNQPSDGPPKNKKKQKGKGKNKRKIEWKRGNKRRAMKTETRTYAFF